MSKPADLFAIAPDDANGVLALNNLHAAELSLLDAQRLAALLKEAFFARRIGDLDAFLIAFDQDADYDSPNFLWFRARYARFVYVDRIAVAAHARGRGLARLLYQALFAEATSAGHDLVTCEVNSDPPNPASDAFHAALGFAVIGEGVLGTRKSVRYFARRLDAAG